VRGNILLMQQTKGLKLLFIVNNNSGNNQTDWRTIIEKHFESTDHTTEFYELTADCNIDEIKKYIKKIMPDKIVAVGGDGTVKLAAECIMEHPIPLAIIPAGSANGMAKELGIATDAEAALNTIIHGHNKKIHLVKVNDELCIHLSDIGFNAFMIKEFDKLASRGMWGYAKASWAVIWKRQFMQVDIRIDGALTTKNAAMIVIANATRYGTGALINPNGRLDDDVFEVIVIKQISLKEIFKMMVTHGPYDPEKTEVYQTSYLQMHSKKKVHFQVDGEYLGKVNDIRASILENAIEIIVPTD
jgi:diacylglycerol kinase (ATP)